MKKMNKFLGGRVFKTAIAIFLTAWICQILNWPPVFAVITAIVTLEPTVADSIKKGIIRFPASAIGSAYAVTFIYLFGNTPITYTLAAFFTIATCFKLRLHAGLLVATLTSVAMIEVIHSNFLIAFFIRLGTTSIGLIVSTVVNMFVLPPNYQKEIEENIQTISRKTGLIIEKIFKDIFKNMYDDKYTDKRLLKRLDNRLTKTEKLIQFQKDEAKYHPLIASDKDNFLKVEKQLNTLRLLHYHLTNLIQTPFKTMTWSEAEYNIVVEAIVELAESLKSVDKFNPDSHTAKKKQLMNLFWEDNKEITSKNDQHLTYFPPDLIVLYELLSIYNLVAKYYRQKQ